MTKAETTSTMAVKWPWSRDPTHGNVCVQVGLKVKHCAAHFHEFLNLESLLGRFLNSELLRKNLMQQRTTPDGNNPKFLLSNYKKWSI